MRQLHPFPAAVSLGTHRWYPHRTLP